jgi:D-serine deaminase-like pyridoxal phosphate-dependent protein
LLLYVDRVEENIRRMIGLAGDASRLRPHIKTHKLPEIVRLQLAHGITRFKCATLAEAEMAALAGAVDVLLAYQPVGPNIERLIQLSRKFPAVKISALADNAASLRALAAGFAQAGMVAGILLDVDCGMHRCGIEPGPEAVALYQLLGTLPGLKPGGLHVYDGHIDKGDAPTRARQCVAAFAPVRAMCEELTRAGLPVPAIVAGGTPTFPLHAQNGRLECSPGTTVLWDWEYSQELPDLDFLHAALVLTRVVSKPGGNRLCLDLGHKSIASEKPHPRVHLLNLPDAQTISHSEEHLVVASERAGEFEIGACLYGVPRHICPTVALHSEAVVVRAGLACERWKVIARERRLSV